MAILALLAQSWVGELITSILGWFKDRAAARAAAQQEMMDDVQAHARDGQASVEIRRSYEAQIAELRKQLAEEQAKGTTNPVIKNEPLPAEQGVKT